MCERDFQINVERQLNNIIPHYNETIKFPSDTLFHFINKAKDEYVKQNFRVFQRNQEITDNIRTLVNTKDYTTYNLVSQVTNGKPIILKIICLHLVKMYT